MNQHWNFDNYWYLAIYAQDLYDNLNLLVSEGSQSHLAVRFLEKGLIYQEVHLVEIL